jgi:hypothetical protein
MGGAVARVGASSVPGAPASVPAGPAEQAPTCRSCAAVSGVRFCRAACGRPARRPGLRSALLGESTDRKERNVARQRLHHLAWPARADRRPRSALLLAPPPFQLAELHAEQDHQRRDQRQRYEEVSPPSPRFEQRCLGRGVARGRRVHARRDRVDHRLGVPQGCPAFCIGGDCTEGTFTVGELCSDIPACGRAPQAASAPVPALGVPGLLIPGVAPSALGLHTTPNRQAPR